MWFKIINPFKQEPAGTDHLVLSGRKVPLVLVRHSRAKRYLLRLTRDGTARVTIPKRGSVVEARRFVEKHMDWLEKQLQNLEARPNETETWQIGTKIWLAGELVSIQSDKTGSIRIGTLTLFIEDSGQDLRPLIEKHLRKLAALELPKRVLELAAQHRFSVQRITVRNQRTRWGSCSRKGNISLNWHLIQTPDFVRDYIILHELAHLRHMNHSKLYWEEVDGLCPGYMEAERWLKERRGLLG